MGVTGTGSFTRIEARSLPERDHAHSNASDGRKKTKKEDAATGVSAASARAVAARAAAFYFYLAFARAINPRLQANEAWSWRITTPGILGHAVQTYGWSFIPKQVLPPLFANVIVGSLLYTTYLTTLSALHPPLASSPKRPSPPPPFTSTFTAGLLAGTLQSLLASPLDALHVRFKSGDMLSGRYSSTWHYAFHKTREIGVRGVFAGWSLRLLKDSLGCAVFFGSFEWVKAQGFYSFVGWWYAGARKTQRATRPVQDERNQSYDKVEKEVEVLRPHFALEPTFLLLAGMSASFAQALVQYPLALVQDRHYKRLESLDAIRSRNARSISKASPSVPKPRPLKATFRDYALAYHRTLRRCSAQAKKAGGWLRWGYGGFWWNTLRAMPSTSTGLIIFEVVRRRYAIGDEEVRIKIDGRDVLLV